MKGEFRTYTCPVCNKEFKVVGLWKYYQYKLTYNGKTQVCCGYNCFCKLDDQIKDRYKVSTHLKVPMKCNRDKN